MNPEKYIKLISSLAIFLFIIGGNYVGDIYSCKLRRLFNNSMVSKHIIGYFILLLFVHRGMSVLDLTAHKLARLRFRWRENFVRLAHRLRFADFHSRHASRLTNRSIRQDYRCSSPSRTHGL